LKNCLGFLVLAAPLALNAWDTRAVVRSEGSERSEKIAPLLFVWLLPAIGAVIALGVHRGHEAPSRKYGERLAVGDDAHPAQDMED
jgi:hypothetical protein